VTWAATGIKTWDDFLKKPTALGGQGPSSEPDMFARLYKNVFGAPIKLVPGYPGTNEIALAMERGEVDGLCGISWSTLKARHAKWLKDKKINLIVQSSLKKSPEIAAEVGDVPLVMDLTKDKEKLQILKLILAAQEMARPFAAPPDIPADRKAALIKAFDDTMKDPEYLAEAKKLDFDVNPVSAKAIDDLLAELYATPKDVLKKAGEAITK
jgi:tripartite-type tricarboxylate transporter receptor subunit TctC